jgi:hypothetical protein
MNFFKGELKLLGIYLLILFLIIQLSLISGKSTEQQTKIKPQDTLVPIVDATINVQDNVALFIGDSHTANQQNGWQKVLCDKTGMICNNASVGGKQHIGC